MIALFLREMPESFSLEKDGDISGISLQKGAIIVHFSFNYCMYLGFLPSQLAAGEVE